MKCKKCNGNMIQSYEDSKCLQCGYQDVKISEDVLKEIRQSIGRSIIKNPSTPRYYYDLEYRDKLSIKNKADFLS